MAQKMGELMKFQSIRTILSGGAAIAALSTPAFVQAQERNFDVPAQLAVKAIPEFARQAGIQIIAPATPLRGVRSSAVKARAEVTVALNAMLKGTNLKIVSNDGATMALGVASRPATKPVSFSASAVPPSSVPDRQGVEAASISEASTSGDEDIIVTAQGRTQRLQDVPISASVTTGATLARVNLRNLEDVAVRLPNVKISQAPVSDFVNIRGVGSSLNMGFEQSVGTFVDGLYRGRSRATRGSLFDLDRIEVLKGPQTTFFGNNTIAGALNIVTRKPGDTLQTNAGAFYAPASQEYAVEAGISLPLTDNLGLRVAGRMSGMDGYIKNSNLNNHGPDLDDKIGRVSLRWEPSDAIEMNGRVDVIRMRDKGIFNSELIDCPPNPLVGTPAGACARYLAASGGVVDDKLDWRSAAGASFLNYDMVEALWNTKITLGEHSMTFTTGYFDHEIGLANDVAPIPGNQGGECGRHDECRPGRDE